MNPLAKVLLISLLLCQSTCGEAREVQGSISSKGPEAEPIKNSKEAIGQVPRWNLPATPSLEIGGAEGSEPDRLFKVQGAVLHSGLIWVSDGASKEIRAFRTDGTHVLTTGGSGEGPGEFLSLGPLIRFGEDTLVAWDNRLRRISFLNSSGEFSRSVRVLAEAQNLSVEAVFRDGTFLATDLRPIFPRSKDLETSPFLLLRIGSDGHLLDTLGVCPGGRAARTDASPGYAAEAFSPFTYVAEDIGGYWVGTGESPELRRFDPSGELVKTVLWEADDRTVRPEHRSALFERQLSKVAEEEARRALRRLQSETPVANEFPAHASILVDKADRLWVKTYRRPTDQGPDSWLIFEENGSVIAQVEVPSEFRLLDAGEGFVLGVRRDELDVERIQLFTISVESSSH